MCDCSYSYCNIQGLPIQHNNQQIDIMLTTWPTQLRYFCNKTKVQSGWPYATCSQGIFNTKGGVWSACLARWPHALSFSSKQRTPLKREGIWRKIKGGRRCCLVTDQILFRWPQAVVSYTTLQKNGFYFLQKMLACVIITSLLRQKKSDRKVHGQYIIIIHNTSCLLYGSDWLTVNVDCLSSRHHSTSYTATRVR